MRVVYAVLATALATAALSAAPPEIKLPAELRGEPGAFLVVRAETTATVVRFVQLDPGLAVFPADLLTDKKATVMVASKPGKYRVLAYTGNADGPSEPAVCVVIVGTPEPPPPPPPPDPSDPLLAELQRLYTAEASPDKAKHKASLVALYHQAVTLSADPSLKTMADLLGVVRSASANLLPADALLSVRRKIGDWLNTEIGTDPAGEMTPALRQKAAAAFGKMAKTLEALR